MTLLAAVKDELARLVLFDSTNPPRRPAAMMDALSTHLRARGLEVHHVDHGEGAISVLATRGHARTLLTAHLDTVPVAPAWTRDPFALTEEGDRIYGLGTTDVKGGAAAMIAAACATDAPCMLLFTTDEEAGKTACMRHFTQNMQNTPELAVVAEPTRARAVLAHRGIAAGLLEFTGKAAHSSLEGQVSALHELVRWGQRALDLATVLDAEPAGPSGLAGVRFNLGKIEGGSKSNVVAGAASARFGLRPPPETTPRAAMERFAALAPEAMFTAVFEGPPLPASPELGARARELAIMKHELPLAEPVAFWTEASILSAAGLPALVLGPGDIALAHGPDEYVLKQDLEAAAQIYRSILERDAGR